MVLASVRIAIIYKISVFVFVANVYKGFVKWVSYSILSAMTFVNRSAYNEEVGHDTHITY